MTLHAVFQLCTTAALAGWIVLLIAPFAPTLADRVSGLLIPALLAVAYAGLMLAFSSRAEGGFDNLPNVMRLFTKPEIALAGWIRWVMGSARGALRTHPFPHCPPLSLA